MHTSVPFIAVPAEHSYAESIESHKIKARPAFISRSKIHPMADGVRALIYYVSPVRCSLIDERVSRDVCGAGKGGGSFTREGVSAASVMIDVSLSFR